MLYMFTSRTGVNRFKIFAGVLLLYTSCISIEADLKCGIFTGNTPIANMASVARKRGFSVATVAKGETFERSNVYI